MRIFDMFTRRDNDDMSKKNRARTQPVHKVEEVEIDQTPVEQEVVTEELTSHEAAYDQLDLAVAKLMGTYSGTEAPKPYSTDRALVMDMVSFAKDNSIKLPLFTSDPMRIALTIQKWGNK